jgi:putrescine transport system substrate-binding protein
MSQPVRIAVAVAAAVLVALGSARAADQQTLNVYNWSDYIAEGTVAAFEKATGVKVNYDTYDSNETLDAKLAAGNSGYDVVVPSLNPFVARQIPAGYYQKLDKSKLPNFKNLSAPILGMVARYDAGNAYVIPYTTGTTGIGFNVDKIYDRMHEAPVDSLKIMFDPAVVSKFKSCGVTMLDSPTDIYPAALRYLGLDPDSQKVADLEKANQALLKIRPFIRRFDSSEYINDLANGDVCLSLGYSSDINIAKRRAAEANKGVRVTYMVPKEGALRWIDTMAIPKDAPHPDLAHQFLNFIMDPKVIAEVSNEVFIQSGNAAASQFVKPEIINDRGIYPPPELEKNIYTISVSKPDVDRARTRLWTRLKTGR